MKREREFAAAPLMGVHCPMFVRIIFFPLAIFIFCMGWALYYIGDTQQVKRKQGRRKM